MISVNDLRAGVIYEDGTQLLQVMSFEHIKVGRGSANIKVRVKDLRSGSITEKSFMNGAKVQDVSVLKKEMQYLYKDEDSLYFMIPTTYEQVSVPLKIVPEHAFLKEGDSYPVSFRGDEALSLLLPPKVDLKITDTAPGVKGNSASNVFKEATLENGLKTRVPLFIDIGELIKVDTRNGSYAEKAQS